MNPVSWYRGAADMISGTPESEAAAAAERREVSGGFPNVNDVPERPKILSPAERQNIADSLIADRANAKYTEEKLSREGTPTRPLPPRVGTPDQAEPPAAGAEGAAPSQEAGVSVKAAEPPVAAAPRAKVEPPVAVPAPPAAPVARLHFAGAGAELTSEDIAALQDIARQQKSNGGTVRVSGYAGGVSTRADEVGRMVEEADLSIRRTDVVVRELVRLGVPPARIAVTAAETAPASGLTEVVLE